MTEFQEMWPEEQKKPEYVYPGPSPGRVFAVDPNCHEDMSHHVYFKRPGMLWNIYPVFEYQRWFPEHLKHNPRIPQGWDKPAVLRAHSFRAGAGVGTEMELSKQEKREIVQNARSREDFHDVGKIMGAPSWGLCLCELRIISGQKCIKYLMKDKDGPEGKTPVQGVSYCKKRAIDSGGNPKFQACNILLDIPTNDWVLEQHPEDKKGTIAGRVSTDIFLKDSCPQCAGFSVDPKTKELVGEQKMKWMDESTFELSPDFDPAEHTWQHEVKDWPKRLVVTPCQFFPQDGTRKYHPILEPGRYYHIATLHSYSVKFDDIWIPERNQTYQQYFDEKVELEAEMQRLKKESEQEVSSVELKKAQHEIDRENS